MQIILVEKNLAGCNEIGTYIIFMIQAKFIFYSRYDAIQINAQNEREPYASAFYLCCRQFRWLPRCVENTEPKRKWDFGLNHVEMCDSSSHRQSGHCYWPIKCRSVCAVCTCVCYVDKRTGFAERFQLHGIIESTPALNGNDLCTLIKQRYSDELITILCSRLLSQDLLTMYSTETDKPCKYLTKRTVSCELKAGFPEHRLWIS